MTKQEEEIIKAYRKMREIYPEDDLMLINPKSYQGYNLETGKKIRIVQEEYKDD